MRNSAATLVIAAVSLLAISNAALADRIYSSMEKCNRKCHGVCFMVPDGANCHWGALAKREIKVDPKITPLKSTGGKVSPRN